MIRKLCLVNKINNQIANIFAEYYVIMVFVLEIEMPSSQFKFVISNTTVGTLHEPSSQVIGRAIGFTQVKLFDNSIL